MSPFRFAASRSTWLTPIVLILGLAVLFPAIYLSALLCLRTSLTVLCQDISDTLGVFGPDSSAQCLRNEPH